VDVAHALVKDPEMPDLGERFAATGPAAPGHPHWDRDEVHDVYRAWRRIADAYPGERMFVAEAWVAGSERLARYVRPDELHTAFNFGYLLAAWDATELRDVIDDSLGTLGSVGAPASWVLSNHDVVRHVTRYGGGERGTRRARAAALLTLALPGGAYVYQGEELGLPEVLDLPDEVRQDPTFRRSGGTDVGRDGCRVPLPWSGDVPSYGFGPGTESWLPQPPSWAELSVAHESATPGSMLALYRVALRIRRAQPGLLGGDMRWLEAGPGLLAFERDQGFVCVVNVGEPPAELPARVRTARLLVASGDLDDARGIPGATAAWFAA
jgi:alpha-glucosidase